MGQGYDDEPRVWECPYCPEKFPSHASRMAHRCAHEPEPEPHITPAMVRRLRTALATEFDNRSEAIKRIVAAWAARENKRKGGE